MYIGFLAFLLLFCHEIYAQIPFIKSESTVVEIANKLATNGIVVTRDAEQVPKALYFKESDFILFLDNKNRFVLSAPQSGITCIVSQSLYSELEKMWVLTADRSVRRFNKSSWFALALKELNGVDKLNNLGNECFLSGYINQYLFLSNSQLLNNDIRIGIVALLGKNGWLAAKMKINGLPTETETEPMLQNLTKCKVPNELEWIYSAPYISLLFGQEKHICVIEIESSNVESCELKGVEGLRNEMANTAKSTEILYSRYKPEFTEKELWDYIQKLVLSTETFDWQLLNLCKV